MRKTTRHLLALTPLLVVLVAVPAHAAAPGSPDPQYESFDRDDALIKDRFTKLQWERRVLKASIKSVAEFSCSNGALGVTGRLPSIKELLTIFDEEPHLEYEGGYLRKNIDQSAFDESNGEDFSPIDMPYWSQTPASPGKFWTLNFTTGAMTELAPSEQAHTRCVKG